MAGQGMVQGKTGILCGPKEQCLAGRALVSTDSGGLQRVVSTSKHQHWLAALL